MSKLFDEMRQAKPFTVTQYGCRLDGHFGITGRISGLSSADVRAQWRNAVKRKESITVSRDGEVVQLWHFLPMDTAVRDISYCDGRVIYHLHRLSQDLDTKLAEYGYSLESAEFNVRTYRPF